MVEQFVLQDIVLEDVAKSAEDDNHWDDWKIEECGNEHDEVVREQVVPGEKYDECQLWCLCLYL